MINPQAFPLVIPMGVSEINEGMTLRDYFAAAAMQGLIANPEFKDWPHSKVAEESFVQADLMIEQRPK